MAALALTLAVAANIAVLILTPAEAWAWGIVLSILLSWASLVDIDRHILPDVITISLILLGLCHAALTAGGVPLDQIIGAVAGYASLALVKHIYSRLRSREGLGLGDAKLFAAAGAWLGWASLPNVMIGAALVALAYVGIRTGTRSPPSHNERLAFGPYLALSMWALWIWQAHGGL